MTELPTPVGMMAVTYGFDHKVKLPVYDEKQMREYAQTAVLAEREACLVGIQAEIDHAAINDTRLAPSFGKREGVLAVRIGALEAALDAIRARGDK
jgi:hypothetical protein